MERKCWRCQCELPKTNSTKYCGACQKVFADQRHRLIKGRTTRYGVRVARVQNGTGSCDS